MTPNQRSTLMIEWWPSACSAQKWKTSDKPLRLRVLSLALNFKFGNILEFRDALENYAVISKLPARHRPIFREIQSANDLNTREDIDAVKALLLMLADNLAGAGEQGRPQDGHGRRSDIVIGDLIKCLALYPLAQPMGIPGAEAYVMKIARQKISGFQRLADLDDNPGFRHENGQVKIAPSDRQQILYTISARLNGKTGYRNAAGHTLHQMKKAAGVPCHCAAICNPKRRLAIAPMPATEPEPEERFDDLPAVPTEN